ncbi:MAG: cytochrome-c oxidase, cbb3-type subunit III [Pseudomonadota bacterium]|nr:cytochrome-c oxidase, cbb3-type subunit III [Pseudomonadota bacterium]
MTDFAGSDFSEFWHYYIAAFTVLGILFSIWLLSSQTTKKLAEGEQAEALAPTWDGDLKELNNPLPRWWMWMFYGLIFFGIGYLVLYPGMGKFAGTLGWTSFQEWKDDKDAVDAEFDKVMGPYKGQDIMTVAADAKAREMGQNLFMTYCSQCHGSSAQGGKGFPNLTDAQWLFGGSPEDIQASIAGGRIAEMPAMGDAVGGEQGAREVANYVLSLGGKQHDATLAAAGQAKYAACAGCHGEDGKGMAIASFPDLTDDAWQHGGSESAIAQSIIKGRKGGMPAQSQASGGMLSDAKIHLLTAYVWGLGGGKQPATPAPVEVMAAPAEAAPAAY